MICAFSDIMAFGTDLQGWSSHKALLGVQDLEICLMEVMKKFLSSRIKSDRDYSSSLSSIIAAGQKLDPSDFSTPLCQVSNLLECNVKYLSMY